MNTADATPQDQPVLRVWRIWPFAFGLATIVGLFSALVLFLGMHFAGRSIPVSYALTGVADWYIWAALTPLAAWFGLRFPVGPDRRYLGVPPHLVAGAAVALAELAAFTVYNGWYNRAVLGNAGLPFVVNYPTIVAQWFPVALLVYWLIVTAVSVYEHQRRYRAKELSSAHLETELTQAKLEMLRAQLHPHFLFNTLNTVAVLVREGDQDRAVDTLASLGGLLRRSLEYRSESFLPLREEIAFVREYLAIEQQRYGERICVSYDIQAGTEEIAFPALLLQPIVENAVRHGVAKVAAGGRLTVSAVATGDWLAVAVRDTGPGFDNTALPGASRGVGLANTAQRLQRLYGDAHTFEARNVPDGAEVVIRLPIARR